MQYDFTDYTVTELRDLIADTEQQLASWSRIEKLRPTEREQIARNTDLLSQAKAALDKRNDLT